MLIKTPKPCDLNSLIVDVIKELTLHMLIGFL